MLNIFAEYRVLAVGRQIANVTINSKPKIKQRQNKIPL